MSAPQRVEDEAIEERDGSGGAEKNPWMTSGTERNKVQSAISITRVKEGNAKAPR
jgi:hypothetical protein